MPRIVAAADRHSRLILGAFSIAYLMAMIYFAPRRPMWIDEYITFYLSRLSLPDIRSSLLTGADSHPPAFFYLTHASMKLFGVGVVALRLPAILGFLLMTVCVFRFVATRSSRIVALAAAAVLFTTRATTYAMEGRGYGMLMGLTALALLCWQKTEKSPRRSLWSVALGLVLIAGTLCHYFGSLVVVPLAVGELVRTVERRRISWPTWAAFLAPILPLLYSVPYIRASRSYAAHHGLLNSEFDYFSFVLRDGHALLLILLVAVAAATLFFRSRNDSHRVSAFPLPEIAVVATALILPVAYFGASRILHLPFADRYVLSGAIAVSLLVAIVIDAIPRRETVAALTLAGLVVWAGGNYLLRAKSSVPGEAEIPFVQEHSHASIPIVAADLDTFFRLNQTNPQLAGRIVYLTNPSLSLRYLGNDTSDRILVDLRPYLPLHSESFCSFLAANPAFEVYGPVDPHTNWVMRALLDRDFHAELLGVNDQRMLLFVHANHSPAGCGVGISDN